MSDRQLTLRAAVRFIVLTVFILIGYVLLHIIARAPFLVAGL